MPQGREWPKAGYLLLHTRLSYAFERASLIFISILSSRLNEQPLNEKQNIHVKWTRFTTLLSRYILLNFFFPSGSFRHNFQLLGELAWWTRWLEIHCSSWYKERWRTSASVSLRCKFFFFFFFLISVLQTRYYLCASLHCVFLFLRYSCIIRIIKKAKRIWHSAATPAARRIWRIQRADTRLSYLPSLIIRKKCLIMSRLISHRKLKIQFHWKENCISMYYIWGILRDLGWFSADISEIKGFV